MREIAPNSAAQNKRMNPTRSALQTDARGPCGLSACCTVLA